MATFRAIHPYVREQAFELGFEPVPGNHYKVQHPRVHGKRAQVLFYKAFSQAAAMRGVRRVVTPGTDSGTTLLFPQVPESRWEAARRGVKWVEPTGKLGTAAPSRGRHPSSELPEGTIGDLIRDKLKLISLDGDSIRLLELAGKMGIKGTDLLLKALSLGMRGTNLNTWLSAEEAGLLATEYGFRIDTYRNRPLPPASAPPPAPRPRAFKPRNLHFNGALDGDGCLVTFQVTTTDDATARRMLESLALGVPGSE